MPPGHRERLNAGGPALSSAVAAAGEPAEQAAELLSGLGSLRHGRWWPPLDEVIETARRFYPGALAESPSALLR